MISASFLAKHLFTDYRRGERHFFEQLTDGDLSQNNTGWQWSAGCGVDAQPYFRVFNPTLQGKKFDAEGDYVRRWIPALSRLPTRYVHCPWAAPAAALHAAGVVLGRDYPRPVVDHAEARARFLAVASSLIAKG
jgi:deoxyribodipyrimidine photo-lyase